MGDLSPRVRAYVALIRAAERAHAEVGRGLMVEGLTSSQFGALKALALRGPLAQKEIAASLLKTGGNVTLVVDNLERMGMVEREVDPADRRVSVIRLTDLGRATFDRIYPEHLERIEAAMACLGDDECDALATALSDMAGLDAPICAPRT